MPYYKASEVRALAKGQWHRILAALAPALEAAIKRAGRHVPCPVHGGKDGFRLFRDFDETGGGWCNTCGPRAEGFTVLMWVNRWSFREALEEVGKLLSAPLHQYPKEANVTAIKRPLPALKPLPAHPTAAVASPPAPVEPVTTAAAQPPEQAVVSSITAGKPWLEQVERDLKAQKERDAEYQKDLVRRTRELWKSGIPPESSKVLRAYLDARGLAMTLRSLDQGAVRFVSSCNYFDQDGNLLGKFPAMVAAISDKDGNFVSLHRTYLTKSGKKARLPSPEENSAKKMTPTPQGKSISGGAIRLMDYRLGKGWLSVAEGIETALSAYRGWGIPAWSTVNATLLERFCPPEDVHTLLIWEDKDKSERGSVAAAVLKERMAKAGKRAIVLTPPMPIPKRAKGVDWNDVLVRQGMLGFPRRSFLDRLRCETLEVEHGAL